MVVWSKQFGTGLSSKDNPLNQLIGTVLLEERAGEETYSHETMNMKWTRDNQLQLVFVVRTMALLRFHSSTHACAMPYAWERSQRLREA